MSRHFAMCVSSPQASTAAVADSRVEKEAGPLRAGLAARVASGPGLWLQELEGLDREGLLEQLLAEGAIGEAAATAPHSHRLDRVLTAKNTLLSLITGCLFAGQGYDQVLRTAFAMPGLDPVAPGTPVPTVPALSKARARSGEHVARRAFELDAARAGAELGTGQLWHGMEVTAFDGTTAALDANDELDAAFGVPGRRQEPHAPPRRPGPHRHAPVGRRRHRRLPRRGERPRRPAGIRAGSRHAQPRRPRLLCAMRRTVVSPAQRAEMRGDYLWI